MGPQALLLLGGGLKVAGKLREAAGYKQAGKLNQQIADRNAAGIESDAAAQESAIADDVRRTMGTQIAAQGESGFESGTGSALDALMASQVEGMLDRLTVRRGAQGKADSERFRGVMARREGNMRATEAYWGAAEALVDTAKNYANYGAGG